MKFTLALSLLLSCACFTTVEGYQTEREFNVQTPTLKVTIDYERELSAGEANKFSILHGLLAFGPSSQITILWFLKFGRTHEVYSGSDEGSMASSFEALLFWPLPLLLGLLGGDSLEEAAAHDALYPDDEDGGAHVLGFPLYRSDVTDLFLVKWETVTVEGFRGKVTNAVSSW